MISDLYPRRAVATVAGMGGMAGAAGRHADRASHRLDLELTGSVHCRSCLAGFAYLLALTVTHLLIRATSRSPMDSPA